MKRKLAISAVLGVIAAATSHAEPAVHPHPELVQPPVADFFIAPDPKGDIEKPVYGRHVYVPRPLVSEQPIAAPELDTRSGIAAISLLALCVLIMFDRRPKV
jgi:hypothetical protein